MSGISSETVGYIRTSSKLLTGLLRGCLPAGLGAVYQIYTDIAAEPRRFSLPLYKKEENRYGSKEVRAAKVSVWSVFYLLEYLFFRAG
jgi:hypothetical protein